MDKRYFVARNATIGFLAGGFVAIGGAYKDAPSEGFYMDTFLRSPIMGVAAGVILGEIIKPCGKPMSPLLMFFVALAGERFIMEFYKHFRQQKSAKFEMGEYGVELPKIRDKRLGLQTPDQFVPEREGWH